jgi:AraC-like DNA-binding protein
MSSNIDESIHSQSSLRPGHVLPMDRRPVDQPTLRVRTDGSATAVVLVVHASALIAAGLAATLERHPNITVRIWDASQGPWVAREAGDVDVVFADSDGLRFCQQLHGGAGGWAKRPPKIVWVTTPSQAVSDSSPAELTSSARLSVECREADVIRTLKAVSCGERRESEPRTGGLAPGALRRVLGHIEENLDTQIPMATLARLAGLSVCHFARAFKQSVGVPPHRYLINQRLSVAARLIVCTDSSLMDVALTVGFCDQSHFTRLFSRSLGESPSSYRRRHR